MRANNHAASSSTPTKPVAEVRFLRYGVRYRSTLLNTSLKQSDGLSIRSYPDSKFN